jgi:hypothetical protein
MPQIIKINPRAEIDPDGSHLLYGISLAIVTEMKKIGDHNEDLHGNVPDTCNAALLLVDVINDLDFLAQNHSSRRPLSLREVLRR